MCPFCNVKVNFGSLVEFCPTCKTEFLFSPSSLPKPYWIEFRYSNYSIGQLPLSNNEVRIFKDKKFIMGLDSFLPLNPKNAESYMNKLLNMKAFI